ncbi:exocyst complex component EXO70B1-like [Senna tora]|uniref:Exocyst subunit Exo70 family protein n=1 Tax=Senna tora TaxID=362788 RepID=A0A834T4Z0_9FABA|nr:exocyst complex component EXO70B1-like [Senna tora]
MASARISPSEKLTINITIATLEAFLTRLSRHAHRAWANRRPWIELLDRTAICRPESLAEAASRIRKNLYYFRVNYLIVLALVLAVSLLSHPLSLLLLGALIGAWLFLYVLRPSDQQLVIFGRAFSDCEALIGLSLVTVVVILLTSVVSLLVSTFTMGLVIVCAHGAFRVPEDLFLEEQGPWASGLFAFVGNSGPWASLSLSRQIDLGFEVDLFNFFLGLLIAQLMMFNKWLAFVGAPICYFLMLLRSYLDSKPHTESETISINGHVTVQIDASNEVEEEAQSDSENGFYTILREDTVHFAPDIEDKLKNTVDAGFAEDCCHVFISWRRQILDNKLLTIRLEKLNLNEIENVPLNFLENKIQRWIMASNYLIRTLLPSERNLCNRVFSGFTPYGDFCFTELCKRPVIQLLNFADAIAAGNGSPERLFRILGLFETLRDLLPGFDSVFSNQYSVVLRNRAFDIERRLREAIKGIFMELENLTHQESAKVVLSNGGLHPLTHYIMNYLGVACKSWRTLERVFRGESSSSSSFSVQVSQIMDLLNSSLERISRKYKDSVLCSVFMMNNLRYIVQKSKRSEVGMVLGEKWIQKHVRKVREYLVEYKSRSWSHVVGMLGDTMRPDAEKIMKVFRLEIEGICEAQSKWVMFDEKLSERVRSSLKKTLVSAYEEGEGTYMKQEDIVAAIDKLFKERDELKNCRNIQPSWTLITPAAQDSYEWSKHAQETILNSTSPRNHYWCIHKFKQGCQASKQVQLIQDNPKIYKTRYTGFHTCRFCRIIPEAPEMLTIADNEESSIICPESSTHPLKQE